MYEYFSCSKEESLTKRTLAQKRISERLAIQLEQITGARVYFANPYISWERELNEHQNELMRDLYPKKTDYRDVSDKKVADVENNLNNKPRKALGFLTPAEAIFN